MRRHACSGDGRLSRVPRLAIAGLGAAAAWALPATAAHVAPVADVLGIPLRLPHRRGIALTFDDGPDPDGTREILRILRARHVPATFFLVGEQVERRPWLAAEIVAAGHDVAVHGYRHRLLLRRRPRALACDLERAAAVIAGASGRLPAYYRPPYGIFSWPSLGLVRRHRWSPILWSRWGRDWSGRATAAGVARLVTSGLEPGDVVLLHDADSYSSRGSWRVTAEALPSIIDAGERLGVPFVLLSQPT